jgi:HD-GYP domain-containing protein (c-di-GMP phosphodiesterase class II)
LRRAEDNAQVPETSEIKEAERFLRHLSACTRNLLFYPQGHEVPKRSIQSVYDSTKALLGGRPELSVGLLDDEWIVHSTVLHGAGSLASDLKQRLHERNLTSITLAASVTHKDLEALADLLTRDPESVSLQGATSILRELGATAVTVGFIARASVTVEAEEVPDAPAPVDDHTIPDFLRCSAMSISELYSEATQGTMDLARAKAMLSDILDIVGTGQANLEAMLAIKSHDDYTFTHIVNVCVLTLAQARRLNLKEELLDDIGLAALMHDVGKQRVPGEIIRKSSKLTDEEFEIIKMHPIYGAEMLQEMPGAPALAGMVAFEHHLRYDCEGYPRIRRPRQLNLCTHLTSIADAFDAMRTLRSYSKKMVQEEVAIRMAKDGGTQFEPVLLSRFFRMLNFFPRGSEVILSTGEEAIVVKTSPEDVMRPVVKVTKDPKGKPFDGGRTIDLTLIGGPEPVTITGVPEQPGGAAEEEDEAAAA